MKTVKEIRSAFKEYASEYISSCFYDDVIHTQLYATHGPKPISPGGYFLTYMGDNEDLLLQAAEINNLNELPEPESGYREDSIKKYWKNQLGGAFYEASCELANKVWGVGGWHEDTVPENGGWKHKVLYKNDV